MKKYLLAGVALLNFGTAAYAIQAPANLTGKYVCSCIEVGTNQKYDAIMTLKKTGQTYAIKSVFSEGSTYYGTGIYDPMKGVFSIAFYNPQKAEESGVTLAEVKKDYSMTGTWTYFNKKIVSTSSCVKK